MRIFAALFAVFCFFAAHAALAADNLATADTNQFFVSENEDYSEEPAEDSPAADAEPNFMYFGARVGLSLTTLFSPSSLSTNDSLLNYNYGFALGHNFFEATAVPLRLEFDVAVRGGGKKQQLNGIFNETIRVKSLSTGMAQAWIDWPISGRIKPYAGGGVGIAFMKYRKVESDGATSNKNVDFAWAWMLGGGIALKLEEDTILDFGYRYVETTALEIDFKHDHYNFKARAHDLHIGLRSSF